MRPIPANAANILSSMTGVSQKDLLQQAEKMVAASKAGGLASLSSLDAALAASGAGQSAATERSFATMTQTRANETHLFESANVAFGRMDEPAGFAGATPTNLPPTQGTLAKSGQAAIDRMKASPMMMSAQGLMDGGLGQAFQEMMNDVEGKIRAFDKNKGGMDAESRQLQFEKVKNAMQKITEMQNMLTNVLKTMHDGAMNAVRNIRA